MEPRSGHKSSKFPPPPGGGSNSSSGAGLGDPSQYERLLRGSADGSANSADAGRRAGHSSAEDPSSPLSPAPVLPPWSPASAGRDHSARLAPPLRWLLPAGLFLLALFVQNLGQYAGTRRYVRWMDVLNHPEESGHGTLQKLPVVEAALIDRGIEALGGSEVSSLLGFLTSVIPLVWLVWILHAKDLKLWVHMLLTVSVLAGLKGFLSWATVVPDAAGWSSCQKRLGDDGLKYYRQGMTGFLSIEAVIDIILLMIHGLWASGEEARWSYCTSGFMSTPIYVSTAFSLGVCELAHRMTQPSHWHDRPRFQLRLAALSIQILLVTLNVICPLINRHHYTADVVVSLLLPTLLYSNPAIALVAMRWSQVSSKSASLTEALFAGTGLSLDVTEEADDDVKVIDVGQVLAVPWPIVQDPIYYLRTQPGRLTKPGAETKDSNAEQQLQTQSDQFSVLEQKHIQEQAQQEAVLRDKREKARQRAAEAAKDEEWNIQAKVAEHRGKLVAEEQRKLAEARQQLIADRDKAEQERRAVAEVNFNQERTRLEEKATTIQQEMDEVTAACRMQEASIAETQQKAQELLGNSASAAFIMAEENTMGAAVDVGVVNDADEH